MSQPKNPDYYINPTALTFTPNYQDLRDVVYVSIVSNAAIAVYKPGAGIDYSTDASHQRWQLSGSTTKLGTTGAYFIYARLSRTEKKAMVIFSVNDYNVDGSVGTGEGSTEASAEYWYIKIGSLTASNGTTNRELDYDSGILGTARGNAESNTVLEKMFKYNPTVDTITMQAPFEKLLIKVGGFIEWGARTLRGIVGIPANREEAAEYAESEDTLVTPKYVKEYGDINYVSKINDDSVDGNIDFRKNISVDGNTSTDSLSVAKDATIAGDQVVSGNSTIGGNQSVGSQTVNGEQIVKGEQTLHEGVTFGSEGFVDGLTGWGGKIDGEARATLRSLRLWESLEVPELRYNRIEIQAGNSWRSAGGGIIEKVEQEYDSDGNPLAGGIITLRLEEGEIGKIARDDICMGVFHNMTNANDNETIDSDDSRGNFTFAGFFTAYFRVTEILDNGNNGRFRYVLRGSDGTGGSWNRTYHPCKDMHFAAYGNFTDPTRQDSRYSTLTYERYLRGVNTWEFGVDNIAAQFGDLSNLSILGLNMTGYSVYIDNAYMRGYIQQVNVLPLRLEIVTDGYTTMAYGETMNVECHVYRGWEELTDSVTEWSIVRETADTADDAAWGLKDKVKKFAGAIDITWNEQENDLGDMSKAGISALFTITAKVSDETTSASIEI